MCNFYEETERVHAYTHACADVCPHTHHTMHTRIHTHTHICGIYEAYLSNAHTNLPTDVTGFWFVRFEFLPNNVKIGFMCCKSQHY
jgi:heme/copper-type cytochrome/quinol oxidase subunit 2